jgi:hypothetical protein
MSPGPPSWPQVTATDQKIGYSILKKCYNPDGGIRLNNLKSFQNLEMKMGAMNY